jgi:hypothetical protein
MPKVLNDGDFLTIISFGSYARMEMPKTAMAAAGKTRAREVINSLTTAGTTPRVAPQRQTADMSSDFARTGTTNLIDAMSMSLKVLPCPLTPSYLSTRLFLNRLSSFLTFFDVTHAIVHPDRT